MKIMKKVPDPKPASAKGSAAKESPASELQKRDARISMLESKTDALTRVNELMMKELNGMKVKLQSFKGAEEVQKMTRDVAKKLEAMRTIQSNMDSYSSKVEKIFTDMQKKYADIQKLKDIVGTLTESVTSSMKEVNGLKVKMASLPDKAKMEELQKSAKQSQEIISAMPKTDMKMIREFLAKSGYLESQSAGLKVKVDNIVKIIDIFTDRVNSIQKDFAEMKSAKSRPEGKPGEITELRERVEEIEEILENITEKLKSTPPVKAGPAAPPIPPELKDARPLMDRISRMESTIKDMRERLASVDDDIAKVAEQKPQPQAPQEPPVDIKPVKERLDSLDTRITGINDKLLQLSGDAQKLSNYFMEGMKYMEDKIKGIEKTVSTEDRVLSAMDSRPITIFKPTTYQSHLRRPVPEPVPDNDVPDDYEVTPRQALSRFPSPPRPAQPVQIPEESLPAPFPGTLPPPPSPERGNMFTKLRDGTVERRPLRQMDPDTQDIDIITEHIWESIRRRESREKITRDLMNAGFEKEIIDKAFMQARVG